MREFEEMSESEVIDNIAKTHEAFLSWRDVSFSERAEFMLSAASILRENKQKYAEIITLEMGKPIAQSRAEVEKCAWVCEFYAEKTEQFLARETIETDAGESYVQFDPEGVILAVMPWNFPFWQVIRAAVPAIMAGNTILLKHASNVPQAGMAIEEIFREAKFPERVFTNLLIGSRKVEAVIRDKRVRAVTLTGSEYAGSQVAMQAGSEIKKTVLELGGSDPFIVLADADIPAACEAGFMARFQSGGQSCIAAKRFIVIKEVFNEFVEKYNNIVQAKKIGDPMEEDTQIGPLATEQIRDDIERQVKQSIKMGAEVIRGAKRWGERGYFFEPTLLAKVTQEMPVFKEETFGPISAIIEARDEEHAIKIANDTEFGLGSSIWTRDTEKAKKLAGSIDAGAVFINGMVRSDPRLPFGGTKKSGFGRELSHYGIKEFVNIKTVWIK